MTRPVILAAIAVAALMTIAWVLWPAQTSAQDAGLNPDDPTVVSLGREVYAAECAACHGVNLEGQENWRQRDGEGLMPAPPHNETGHTWHHDGDTLFRLTKYGVAELIGDPNYRSNMPAYEGVLSDAEIWAVLSYIKSTWPADIRERHDLMEENQ